MKKKEKHHAAYETMLKRIHEFYEQPEQKTEATFQNALLHAKNTAIKLSELTENEAELIAAYVKRDSEDAADFLNKTGKALRDWLNFDLLLVEDKLRLWFNNAVDITRVELINMQQTGQQFVYKSGEIVGPGTLRCQHCGEILRFEKVTHIPTCPKCSENLFVRIAL